MFSLSPPRNFLETSEKGSKPALFISGNVIKAKIYFAKIPKFVKKVQSINYLQLRSFLDEVPRGIVV